jgi:DNA repair protein RecO (recombination protein O)
MPRPLRSFRTPALILKRRDIGEADRLLTLFTPEYGKIDVVAKGARKANSTKTGHVELFTRADALIAKGSIDILTQVEMTNPYLSLREDLLKGAYANYCVELLDRFSFAEDTHNESLFKLLDDTFERLCTDADIRRVVRYFELHLLKFVGFEPELQECVITHEMLIFEDQFFSYAEGGVVSPDGLSNTSSVVALPMNTLKALRHLQRSTYKQVANLKMNDLLHNDLERIMLGYIRYVLESKLQSVEFIRLLQR